MGRSWISCFSATAHPAEINKRVKSGEWKLTGQGRTGKDGGVMHQYLAKSRATNRLTARFVFVGKPMDKYEAERLLSR